MKFFLALPESVRAATVIALGVTVGYTFLLLVLKLSCNTTTSELMVAGRALAVLVLVSFFGSWLFFKRIA